ncbi:MAG TPA: cyclic peptide export ABC transporter [Thermoanaerobaculia bacterium]
MTTQAETASSAGVLSARGTQRKKRRSGGGSLLATFGRFAPNRVFASVIFGALSGALYSLAIPLILASIKPPEDGLLYAETTVERVWFLEVSNVRMAGFFLAFCLLILATRALSGILLSRVSMDLTSNLRARLCDRIARAPYPVLEGFGQAKLRVAVTDDVRRIIAGAEILPQLLVNVVMLVGIFGFLCYLNQHVFFFVLKAIAFGVVTFQIPVYFARKDFRRARHIYDSLEQGIRGLIMGVKELQLDRAKRTKYFRDVLLKNERDLLTTEKRALTTMLAANSYGDLLFFFVIGIVAFVFTNYHSVSAEELAGIVLVLLYVTGPVAMILNAIPRMSIAVVSLRKIEEIFGELPEAMTEDKPLTKRAWEQISFRDVTYVHRSDGQHDGFTVGPVDFDLRKGEITFIVGGNGSGKSTLSKMLSLHYLPSGGSIAFDAQKLDADCIDDYRQDVAAIFSDYYLFDRLLCEYDDEKLEMAERYLREFGLQHKVSIRDGMFSTTDLSDGQRKRLALAVSFVDDKKLYLFDEWAADQDPAFKMIFYTEILPELKARGKAVVVVSHDDRYFHVADQVLVMEDGKVVERRLQPSRPWTLTQRDFVLA